MEQKYAAPVDKVFALLTDPKWLEARCMELGEIKATIKAKKAAGGVTLTMQRRVKRELPGIVGKVLSPESDLAFDEKWSADQEGSRSGTIVIEAMGQPVKCTAEFTLAAAGKGCVYRVSHKVKVSVPLIGGTIEKFVLAQIEQGCQDEMDYLVSYLKKNK